MKKTCDTLGLLPSGRLIGVESPEADQNPAGPASTVTQILKLFDQPDASEGLFSLASIKSDVGLPPTFRFWRAFSCHFLLQRCRLAMHESLGELDGEFSARALQAIPPMRGAEYLTHTTLNKHWQALDLWIRRTVEAETGDLSDFLKRRAPHWHQVGRVCFHLAENKQDETYPFAFMATYAAELSTQGQSRHRPLAKALNDYAGKQNKSQLIHLLSPIDLASKSSELIKELVASGDIYHPLAWTPQEAYHFLQEVPQYESAGIVVRLPDWWKRRPRPRVSITLGASKSNTFSAEALLSFDVQMVLGDKVLSKKEWATLMATTDRLIYLKGQWIEVDHEKLQQALSHWQSLNTNAKGLSFIEGMRLLAGTSTSLVGDEDLPEIAAWSQIQCESKLSKRLAELRQPESLQLAQPGSALKASLRPYQHTGVKWLWHLHQLGLGGCLADDMGLGKTIQVIALLLTLKKKKLTQPSLLILPTSLLENWKREIDTFAPSLKTLFLHSSQLNQSNLKDVAANFETTISQYQLVVTTYGLLNRQPELYKVTWQLVIADEAQALKNPGTRQTKAAKKLSAHAKIALTGTPIENRLSDLWSIFDFICPGLLGSATRFKKFVAELEKRDADTYLPLRNLIQPYILRRLKTDTRIITDLPDKTELSTYCSLTKEQAALYAKSVEELASAIHASAEGIQRRGIVLSYLMRFKQICNHPSQLIGDGDFAAEKSGKFARLASLCEEISARQEKVLVFTQFREMCEPLAQYLSSCFEQSGLVLHGGVPVKQRHRLVEQFQDEEGPPFFVISLKAGGTGLNLTAASHVIHFDRWWNPAVEEQATDRAFRIGQKKNVLVHKFVCQGTIEEKIDALISDKKALSTDLLDGGSEKILTEMSDRELIELVTLDVERAVV